MSNPVNATDPSGRYTVDCTGVEDCGKHSERFESVRKFNLNVKDSGIAATSRAFGEPGVDNGVVVTFGAVSEGAAGNVNHSLNYNDVTGTFDYVASVTISTLIDGPAFRAVVAHEGQHVLDGQAFASSIQPDGSSNLALNLFHRETETRAFEITHRIRIRENKPGSFQGGKGLVSLGKSMSNSKLDRQIQQILGGPLYAGRMDERMFPDYAP